MIISVNWLRKFTKIEMPIDELATLIGSRLVEIEEIVDLGAKYRDVIVAKVVEAAPLPDSDHLNLCKIDDGGARKDVERDENGLIQVVCGAPNILDAKLVAWLPPGSIVPETFSADKPFVLESRKLRGQMSNGMIASMRELDLGDEHDGILEIDLDAQAGDSFAELYELDDYLLDIENKSLTHRPDCFGLVGLAREIAAIQGKSFESPTWITTLDPLLNKTADLPAPMVKIADPKICARYQAIVLRNVDGRAKSPILIQSYLSRSGMRPISASVDITNYLMLVTGQPLHAFDYDKLTKISPNLEIGVRTARPGEKMTLLDKREIELSADDILITAGDKPVALAGAMGGAETEIGASTRNIMLESATFDLYALRNTQMRHGIFSEAITRFTKGQPAELTAPVLASAARMFADQTGAEIASNIVDEWPARAPSPSFEIPLAKFADVLGKDFGAENIAETLQNVEFQDVAIENDVLKCVSPWWRTDVNIDEDVIEEIGRINGFDNIEPILPRRDFTAVNSTKFDQMRENLRAKLVRASANEVLTYSFVHGDLLKKAGQNPDESYKIVNSISPDLQYYRQSLTPSLLSKINANIRGGFDKFAIFEINKIHSKKYGLNEEGVPVEKNKVSLIATDKNSPETAPYYDAKNYAEYVLESFGIDPEYRPLELLGAVAAPFEPKRSAGIFDSKTGKMIGVVGELKNAVRRAFKLSESTAALEIDLGALFELKKTTIDYTPPSRYPSVERDVTFQVAADLPYAELAKLLRQTLKNTGLQFEFAPISIYQGDDTAIKNVSLGLKFAARDKTLIGDEIAYIIDKIAEAARDNLNAKII